MTDQHQHQVKYWPSIPDGIGVCECGASVDVRGGQVKGAWHACALCVYGSRPAGRGEGACGNKVRTT